jgi:hypothetical protein
MDFIKTNREKIHHSMAKSSERIIAEWPINTREKIRVRLDVYQGRDIIDLRRWYSDGTLDHKPGRGLTISVRHLPALAAAVTAALSQAEAAGLLSHVTSETP